tara:strand:- start:1167 stop:3974 length:2808 start_codon:yes stop_codon:yes gene_type:complete
VLAALYRAAWAFVAWRKAVTPKSADAPVALWRLLLGAARDGVVSMLPLAILVTFMAYTSGCAGVFGAFASESFELDAASGERHSFLLGDARVRVSPRTPKGDAVWSFGLVCLVIWCIAVPLAYAALLFRARHAILNHQPTLLSIQIGALWREYEPWCYWWEPVDMLRKLILTGAVLLVPETQVMARTVIGLLVSVVALVSAGAVQPFHNFLDDTLFAVTQLVLVIAFIGVLLMDACNEGGEAGCKRFGFDSSLDVSIYLFGFNIAVLVLILVSIVLSFFRAVKTKTLRLRATNDAPTLELREGHRYHTFLSHIWSTGQDQVRGIKGQLQLLMPGIKVFLDVDDLQDISKLEDYIERSGSVLFFLSRRYFVSRNCLREIRASLDKKKPLILVNEADKTKGGQAVAKARAECPEDLRAPIFDGRNPITWLRIADFQLLSLKLICHEILSATPLYSGLSATGELRRSMTGGTLLQKGLYVPGELLSRDLTCEHHKTAVSLFCSPDNPGARAVGEELAAQVGGVLPQDANRNADVSRNAVAQGHQNATHMLLYLDRHTWLGAAGDKLAKSVAAARAQKLPIIIVHEQDESRGACEFSQFFETTPQALMTGGSTGLYAITIAIPLYAPPHRAIGFAMAGLAMGATDKPDEVMALVHMGSTMMSEAAAAAVATVAAAAEGIDDIHISDRMSAAADQISDGLERGVNFLEHASGEDIDNDGDVGVMGQPADADKSERKNVRFGVSPIKLRPSGTARSQAVVAEALPTPSVPFSEPDAVAAVAQPAAAVAAAATAAQPVAAIVQPAAAAVAPADAQPVVAVSQPAAIVAAATVTVAEAVPETSPRRRSSQKSRPSNASSEGQIPLRQQQGAPLPVVVPAVNELGKISTSDELAGAMSGLSGTGASGRSRRRTSSARPPTESTQEAHRQYGRLSSETKGDQSSV